MVRVLQAVPGCLRILIIISACLTGGCTQAPVKIERQPSPVVHLHPETLRAIDEQIIRASVYARYEAEAYARVAMEEWLWRVRQHTYEAFIPWYASYGTQQWIAAKIAWYKLVYTEGEATPEERLAGYLQEQFYEQVLKPVSGFVDPETVMEDTAKFYVRELKRQLSQLPLEFHVPVTALNQHLEVIPAIIVSMVPPQQASLFEILNASELSALPAFHALLVEVEAVGDTANPEPSPDRLRMVAKRAVSKLVESMALRGGAATASTIVGGFWGLVISAGSAAYGVVEHEHDQPAIEAQLRENLDAALALIWNELAEDPRGGVAALMYRMGTQIEDTLSRQLQ
jgi:hypothetical protein